MDLVWQIDLVYDTAERLLLRRVLDPSLREHKELLREQGLTPGAGGTQGAGGGGPNGQRLLKVFRVGVLCNCGRVCG